MSLAKHALHRLRTDARLALWGMHRRFGRTLTTSTRQGVFTVSLTGDDPIGRSLYVNGQYELDFMRAAFAFLREEGLLPPRGQGTVVDVGANNGVISVGMLHHGEVHRAIAIEPEPTNFDLLTRNAKQNGFDPVMVCLNRAVTDRACRIQMELSATNLGDHRVHAAPVDPSTPERYAETGRPVIEVEGDTLDALVKSAPEVYGDEIALVWIDVQGHEGFVFRGASELLSTGVPVVSEIWPYGILRAGMTLEAYAAIAQERWPAYWVKRSRKFVRYPIDTLPILFDELGVEGDGTNIIFAP